jgi:hypothetical protein
VLPGLYVGNYRDSKDINQLEMHKITHILAIHDNPKHLFPEKHYLCVMAGKIQFDLCFITHYSLSIYSILN